MGSERLLRTCERVWIRFARVFRVLESLTPPPFRRGSESVARWCLSLTEKLNPVPRPCVTRDGACSHGSEYTLLRICYAGNITAGRMYLLLCRGLLAPAILGVLLDLTIEIKTQLCWFSSLLDELDGWCATPVAFFIMWNYKT